MKLDPSILALITSVLLTGCSSDPEETPPAKTEPMAKADPASDPLAPPAKAKQDWPPPRTRQPRSGTPAGPTPTPAVPPAVAAPTPGPDSGLVTIALHDVEVRAAVEMLAELAGVQIELTPWARGRVSLTLRAKPWRYALTRLLVGRGEFDVLGNGDRVRVVPRQLRVVGTIVRVEAEALVVNDGKQSVSLRFPSRAGGPEAIRQREDLLRVLQASQPGDRVVCGAAFIEGTRYVTAVLTRPATGVDPTPTSAPEPAPPPPEAPAATKTPPRVVPF